jgi:hypothetical protein
MDHKLWRIGETVRSDLQVALAGSGYIKGGQWLSLSLL